MHLQLRVANSKDYEIVALRRYEIEGMVLNNIQVLGRGISFPLFYQAPNYLTLSYEGDDTDVLMIDWNAELTITCDGEVVAAQPSSVVDHKIIIKISEAQIQEGLQTIVQLPQSVMDAHDLNANQIIKLTYSRSCVFYSKFSRYLSKYTKFKDPKSSKKDKKYPLKFFYTKVSPSLNDDVLMQSNHALQAKIQPSQEVMISQKSVEDQLRSVQMDELIASKITFRVWSFQECHLKIKQQIISLWIDSMRDGNQIVINRSIIKVQEEYFYLTMEEEQLNKEITQLDAIVVGCAEEPNLVAMEKMIALQPIEYLKLAVSETAKLRKWITRQQKSRLQTQVDVELFRALNPKFTQSLSEALRRPQLRLLVTGQKKFGCSFLPKFIKSWCKCKLVRIDFSRILSAPETSLDVVKKYLTYVFSQTERSLIVLENLEHVMRSTDLIDFQQSYLIMISDVLSQHVKRLLLSQPHVRTIFLVNGSRSLLNRKLTTLFTEEMKLEKPNYEQRLKALSCHANAPHLADLADGLAFEDLSVWLTRMSNKDCDADNELELLQGKSMKKTKLFPTFAVIGGSHAAKQQILEVFQVPMRYDFLFEGSGVKLPKGALLYGAPGCGKTYLAQAVANELGVATLYVKGPELLDKYIGGSEQRVRELFEKAASQAPCLIFFDEFDSIVPVRSSSNSGVTDRVVNQFLCYLDGVEENLQGVFILAATSRPDLIDQALLRPGRIERHIHLDRPSVEDIGEIVGIYKGPLQLELVGIPTISQALYELGVSQADVVAFIKEARIALSNAYLEGEKQSGPMQMILSVEAYDRMMKDFRSSLSHAQQQHYQQIYDRFSQGSGPNMKQQQKQVLH